MVGDCAASVVHIAEMAEVASSDWVAIGLEANALVTREETYA